MESRLQVTNSPLAPYIQFWPQNHALNASSLRAYAAMIVATGPTATVPRAMAGIIANQPAFVFRNLFTSPKSTINHASPAAETTRLPNHTAADPAWGYSWEARWPSGPSVDMCASAEARKLSRYAPRRYGRSASFRAFVGVGTRERRIWCTSEANIG